MRRAIVALGGVPFAVVIASACGGAAFRSGSSKDGGMGDAAAFVDADPAEAAGADASPRKCYALQLSGQGQFVEIPFRAALDQNRYTIEAWINPNAADNAGGCAAAKEMQIAAHQNFPTQGWALLLICGGLQLRDHPGGTAADGPLNPSGGSWFHVAGTYDGTTMRIFVDGKRVGQQTTSVDPAAYNGPLRIGAAAYDEDFFFHGLIDDVRLSNRAKYTNDFTPSRKMVVEGDTVGLWLFDEEGQVVRDEKGRMDGTLGKTAAPEASDPVRVEIPCP